MESFDYALKSSREEYKDVPDSAEIVDKVIRKFKSAYDSPPLAEFEIILQKRFTEDEVRVILFNPAIEHMQYYYPMLVATKRLPMLSKLLSLLLSLVFLVHRKSQIFNTQFILCGGMYSLINMTYDENLYVRGQVMEFFLTLTDCDKFDWFQKPVDNSQKLLHYRFLELGNEKGFLANLVRNRIASYPGGSFRALQLLAFWLSWVRALYTSDQKLVLSPQLLLELKLWGSSENTTNNNDTKIEEEIKLASTLYEDFSKLQFQSDTSIETDIRPSSNDINDDNNINFSSNNNGSYYVTGINKKDLINDIPTFPIIISPDDYIKNITMINDINIDIISNLKTLTLDDIVEIKNKGNELYKLQYYHKALIRYQSAIKALYQFIETHSANDSGTVSTLSTHNSEVANNNSIIDLQVSILNNIATTQWKIIQLLQSTDEKDQITQHELLLQSYTIEESLEQCEETCNKILHIAPLNTKAIFRLAQLWLLQNKPQKALEFINLSLKQLNDYCASKSSNATDGISNNSEDFINNIEILNQTRAKCIAAILLQSRKSSLENTNCNDTSSSAAEELIIDENTLGLPLKTCEILKSLLIRNNMNATLLGDSGVISANNYNNNKLSSSIDSILEGNEKLASQLVPSHLQQLNSNNINNKENKTSNKAAEVTIIDYNDHLRLLEKVNTKKSTSKNENNINNTATAIAKKKKDSKISTQNTKDKVYLTKFKKLSSDYDKYDNNATKREEIVNETAQLLEEYWSHEWKISDLLLCTLEEPHVLLLLAVLDDFVNKKGQLDQGNKLYQELSQCDRFNTVLTLTYVGRNDLKNSTAGILDKLRMF